MSKLKELANLGQAIWADYISRSFIKSGELKALIEEGLRGVTSNPTIFDKAISGSKNYDTDIKKLTEENKSVNDIYETLAINDISQALDLFRPLYDTAKGADGFVSLEVDPKLAYNTKETLSQAKRLFQTLNRPNTMIKIPGTQEGLPAITEALAAGLNINVTLLFSVENYKQVANAYIEGLEKLDASNGDVSKVASVASFFVSRIDTQADKALEAKGNKELQGKIAIANAKLAYEAFEKIFNGERWEKLAEKGAKPQRVLWASTSTKNPEYPDTLYVDELIGPDTVNTVPPNTLTAFKDHGKAVATVNVALDEAKNQLQQLADLGIDLEAINQQLQKEGVAAFEKSFESLLNTIKEKRDIFCTV